MKRIAVGIVAALVLAGCSLLAANPFIGTWRADDPFSPGETVYWEFDDTTFAAWNSSDPTKETAEYTYTDTTIVLTYSDNTQEAMQYSFTTDGELVVTFGISIVFTRM